MDAPTATRTRVGIVGAGRVGRALGRALQRAGAVELVAAHARSDPGRRSAAATLGVEVMADPAAVLAAADLVLLCVPDDAVPAVVEAMAAVPVQHQALVVLVSGSVGLDQLEPLRDAGHRVARLHPLAAITTATTPEELMGVPAGIAADDEPTAARTREIARSLGMEPIDIPEDARLAWHAAATMAANHAVALVAAARDVAVDAGIEPALALAALSRLARGAIERAGVEGPERALTGPVSRGDVSTVAAHLQLLGDSAPNLVEGYRSLARQALDLAIADGRVTPGARRQLRQVLDPEPPVATPDRLMVVERVGELRAAIDTLRRGGRSVGFVPTMGALHDGHAQLVRRARRENDVVVVSCFVNPTQFGPGEDLDRYPRSPEADARLVESAGGDVLWRPGVADVYGDEPATATMVRVGPLGSVLEGASRPGHFDGVATVVVRLLGAVGPDRLYLGTKDFQQLAVLRRVLADLLVPVEVRAVATVREPDGLARSSRNAYLTPRERVAARALPRALDAARAVFDSGLRSPERIVEAARAVLRSEPLVEPDYVKLVDAVTLGQLDRIDRPAVLLLAARVGTTRLIDNHEFDPAGDETEPGR